MVPMAPPPPSRRPRLPPPPTRRATGMITKCRWSTSPARRCVADQPRTEQYAQRAAALAEADVLQGRDLVDRGHDQGGTGKSAPCTAPRERVPPDRRRGHADHVGDRAGGGPGEQISAGEEPWTKRRA